MTTSFSIEQMREQLKRAFGNLEIKATGNKMSASVPGFAAYGRHNFLLSLGGDDADSALRNLFEQIVKSAVPAGSEVHPSIASHVYNGNRNEVIYDPGKGLILTKNEYSDLVGF